MSGPTRTPSQVPERVGSRYLLRRRLGSGGMGEVFLADDAWRAGRRVALKRAPVVQRSARESLEREFHRLCRLSHPNVVAVRDFGHCALTRSVYYTMEHGEGDRLDVAVAERGSEEAAAAVVQLCRALDFVHSRRLVHGDVKAENVLVRPAEAGRPTSVKLVDFGLCWAALDERPDPDRFSGTLSHAAPELLGGAGEPGAASDLYSLGVLLYQLHAGRLPFEEADPAALARAHRDLPAPDLDAADLPAEIRGIVRQLLAKRPDERPVSAHAVAEAYAAAAGIEPESPDSLLAHARAPTLVGRDRASSATAALLDSALDQRREGPRSLLLCGPAGTGKSRLLEGLRQRAQMRGVRVLAGRAGGSREPYAGLVEPLREALRHVGSTEAAVRDLLPELVKLDPALGRELGVAPSAPLPAEDERLRSAATFWELLVLVAARPVLLAVDEAHELSDPAAWLVAYLARRLELAGREGTSPPLVVAVAGRLAADSAGALVGESQARGTTLELGALGPEDVDSLLEQMLPDLVPREEVRSLTRERVGGDARLLEQWAASWIRAGALSRTSDGWRADVGHQAFTTAPPDVEQALAQAIGDLDEERGGLLLEACLLPDGLDTSVLAQLTGRDERLLDAGLDELVRLALVTAPQHPDARTVAPASLALRQAALAAFGQAARERAKALLESACEHELLDASARASLAETAGATEAAASEWAAAVADARALGDAVRTAAAAERLAAVTSGERRRGALRTLADALLELDRAEDAERHALAARTEGAAEQGAEAAEQLRLEAAVAARRGRFAEAVDLARQRLDLVPGDAPERWEALVELTRQLGRFPDEDTASLHAELKRLAVEPDRRRQQHQVAGAEALWRGRADEAATELRAALDLLGESPDPLIEATCRNNLGVAELRRGQLGAAARELGRAAELRRAAGARAAMAGTLVNLALLEMERGRPAAASRPLEESVAVKEECGEVHGSLLGHVNLAVAAVMREDLLETERQTSRVRELLADCDPGAAEGVLLVVEGEAAALGRDDAALAAAAAALEPWLDRDDFVSHRHAAELVRLRADLRLPERRARALEVLEARAASAETPAPERVEAFDLLLGAELPSRWRWPWRPVLSGQRLARLGELAESLHEVGASAGVDAVACQAALALAATRAAAGGAGRIDSVEAPLARAEALARRAGRPSLVVETRLARAWAEGVRGRLPEAERAAVAALRALRTWLRRVPTEARPRLLRDPALCGVRESVLALRRELLERGAERGFFAPLADAERRRARQDVPALRRQVREVSSARDRLRQVVEVTRDINALIPVEELLERVLDRVLRFIDAERGFIVLAGDDGRLDFAASRDRSGRSVPRAAFAVSRSVLAEVIRTKRPVHSSDARADSRFTSKESVLLLDLRSVLVAPLVARDEVIGALYVDNSHQRSAFGSRELDLLALFAGAAAVAVENARLHGEKVAKDLLERELSIARDIQQRLIPAGLPRPKGFEVAASLEPARELGGDYYDCLRLADGRLRFAIGDVSGKGVPGALVMALAHAFLRAVGTDDNPLGAVLARVNRLLEPQLEDDKFMTLLLLEPAPHGGSVRTCLAGHEPPLVWRRATGRAELLEAGGLALGMLPEVGELLEDRRVPMAPGDVLTCYTDGITECRAPDGQLFGRDRLTRAIEESASGGAEAVRDAVLGAVEAHRAGADESDDLTVLVLAASASEEEGDE